MKISLNWLGDFVDWKEKDVQKIATRITECTAEVDEVETQGALLDHCCVGKVHTVSSHPNADKLVLAKVETDQGEKNVVCGGVNLKEGMHIAFAHVGARVKWHGQELMTLQKTKIRGETSEGMICAAEELDLATQFPQATGSNIIDLRSGKRLAASGKQDVGTSLREYLGLTDTILHIDNHAITHRPDLFSHIGFARECVAIGLAKWKKEPEFPSPTFTKNKIPFAMTIKKASLMPRYLACMIEIDAAGSTPDWMKNRLEAVGWRSLHLPIDITNFVASEIGVPLHSFDADDIEGDICMRPAKEGEKIITLDSQERTLPEGALVLSDDKGIFDLLGIMGGLRSSTKKSTKRIYLHSASLDPVSIRRTIIATGHRTDAATVYEKGVPHITAEMGFNRAAQLFLDLVPGSRITSMLESKGDNGKSKQISLPIENVQKILGVDIPEKEIKNIFTDLDFDVQKKKTNTEHRTPNTLHITPPLWRLSDIEESHDLIEEIGRVYGYDHIQDAMPSASITPPARDKRKNVLRAILKEHGHTELLPLSLIGPDIVKKSLLDLHETVEIKNPLSNDASILQPSLLPQLLQHAEENILQTGDTLKTFSVGHVFDSSGDEHNQLCVLSVHKGKNSLKNYPFYHLKNTLAAALHATGYSMQLDLLSLPPSYALLNKSGKISVSKNDIGLLCELHPDVCENFDIPIHTSAALINLDSLLAIGSIETIAQSLPRYPAIEYDITVPWNHANPVSILIEALIKKSTLLETVDVQDVYQEDPHSSLYNLTLHLIYRATDRTLTEDEVQQEHQKIVQSITQ
jgi:phenylalanyl-tRNA synthetase beta chain